MLIQSSTATPGTEYWSGCVRIAQSIDQRITQRSKTKLASPNCYDAQPLLRAVIDTDA